jgi:predicted nucleic acid-binding Zn ribbon protein
MQRAGSLIGKLKLSPEMADPEVRARAAWRLAAGKKVAEHTLASAFVRGTLVVEVEDIVWQKQLNALRHFLLRNLAEALGEALVTDIDFRPMPPRRRPQRAEAARRSDDSAGIDDPFMAMLYRQSKKRETA